MRVRSYFKRFFLVLIFSAFFALTTHFFVQTHEKQWTKRRVEVKINRNEWSKHRNAKRRNFIFESENMVYVRLKLQRIYFVAGLSFLMNHMLWYDSFTQTPKAQIIFVFFFVLEFCWILFLRTVSFIYGTLLIYTIYIKQSKRFVCLSLISRLFCFANTYFLWIVLSDQNDTDVLTRWTSFLANSCTKNDCVWILAVKIYKWKRKASTAICFPPNRLTQLAIIWIIFETRRQTEFDTYYNCRYRQTYILHTFNGYQSLPNGHRQAHVLEMYFDSCASGTTMLLGICVVRLS